MIKIDGVAKRNLQEQVGYNSEQIDKIFEILDGLNVQDNLIKLSTSSGTLTAEEMNVVSKDVAFIIYNYNLYIKTTTSATEYTFKQVALSASDQGTYNILQSFRIIITRANGAYLYSSNTVLSLYNKSEMDSLLSGKANNGDSYTKAEADALLALKASLSGADFTGAITSPSITETNSGYSFVKSSRTDIEWVYVGAVKTGNKLTLVIFGNITPTSDMSETNIELGTFYLPADVKNKIYWYTSGSLTYVTAQGAVKLFTAVNTAVDGLFFFRVGADGAQTVRFYNKSSLTNGTKYHFRIEQTYLLSDSLVS